MLKIGTLVSTDYRCPYDSAHPDCWEEPWEGLVLAPNDPRAWAKTLAFPHGTPATEAVDEHLANLAERDIPLTGTPVLYSWGIAWETTEKVKPYAEVLAAWEQRRADAYKREAERAVA